MFQIDNEKSTTCLKINTYILIVTCIALMSMFAVMYIYNSKASTTDKITIDDVRVISKTVSGLIIASVGVVGIQAIILVWQQFLLTVVNSDNSTDENKKPGTTSRTKRSLKNSAKRNNEKDNNKIIEKNNSKDEGKSDNILDTIDNVNSVGAMMEIINSVATTEENNNIEKFIAL